MKKLNTLLCLLLPFAAFAQKGYVVNGKLTALNTPAKAYLLMVRDGQFKETDSTAVKNGSFTFTGQVPEPGQALVAIQRQDVTVKSRRDFLGFFLENSRITIAGTDSIKNARVSGSLSDRQNRELDAAVRPFTDKIIALNNKFGKAPKDEARARASDTVTQLVATIKELKIKYVKDHYNSFIGLQTFYALAASQLDAAQMQAMYPNFSAALKASPLGVKALERVEQIKRRQAGAKVTDFTQADLNGKPFTLSSLRGKYVLVDFWASWCAPCRAENPNVVKAYLALKAKNFEIVSVSLDQGKSAWAGAIEKDGMPWIHVSDLKGWKNEVAQLYGINSVPQNILIDPKGTIVAKNLRGENLLEQLQAYIK